MRRPALVLLAAATALLVGCGGGEGEDAEEEIRVMIEAYADSDDPSACRLYSTLKMAEISTGRKGPEAFRECEESYDDGPDAADDASPRRIEADGDRATVELAFVGRVLDGQVISYALVEESGQWKFDEPLSFAVFDRDRLLLEWARAQYEEVHSRAEADLLGCAFERFERFDDEEIEKLFLRPEPEVLEQAVRLCEPRSEAA